jgi:hypothetical protein
MQSDGDELTTCHVCSSSLCEVILVKRGLSVSEEIPEMPLLPLRVSSVSGMYYYCSEKLYYIKFAVIKWFFIDVCVCLLLYSHIYTYIHTTHV